MPASTTCNVLGADPRPVVCLPGGPLRASSYLGDLGGLDTRRSLALVDLRPIAVTNLVADVETVRRDLDLERVHILAHSAAANLALLYAVAHRPG